jgi:hypothetical protein
MLRALALPDRTPIQRAMRNHAIANARIQLAAATNRHLNPAAVRVLLGPQMPAPIYAFYGLATGTSRARKGG